MNIETTLKEFGFSEKAVKIYVTLLRVGHASVRSLSQFSGINRGTTYDILKELIERGVVSYYHKQKKQYFVASDPQTFKTAIKRAKEDFDKKCRNIIDIIPELQSLYESGDKKPVAQFFEGYRGVRLILEDVLSSTHEYYVYSAGTIRPILYKEYPNFSEDRIQKNIAVKVIAIGAGGEERGLDERKWLTTDELAPTYTLLYANKMAIISITPSQEPIGIIVKDEGIYQTQKTIFEELWKKL